MLQLKNIFKQYKTGELTQTALNEVSLNFRENEFVSILGPSGSGKTTLLNIIGGLDRYDNGDLIINNVSTKKYKDRDWDSYRNHTIGFIFQSYNLIGHQSVLSNVELALTIGGISKKERKQRALNALEKVGLKEQAHKRPNQMSGGQMQRVAIARALVNNPEILLADEPTGALDTETSIQVMELLKEIAKDKLVIMVTHNPELAEQYSTRIVKLKDGNILDDSDPFELDENTLEQPEHKNFGKSSMSIFTAFSLSLNNLLTKKGRTILTSFSGSIGIIGIALILSLSTGFKNYIDKIQEDTLTSYPLSVQAETSDVASMLLAMSSKDEKEVETNTVKENQNIANMFNALGKNDLKSFKKYLEENKDEVNAITSFTGYGYSVKPTIYTNNKNNEIVQLNPNNFFSSVMGGSSSMMTGSVSGMSIYSELIDNEDMVNEEYELITGKFPKNYDEVMLVLPDENSISDLLLYGLGIRDIDELQDMITKIMNGEKVEDKNGPLKLTYQELMEHELKFVNSYDTYKYNEKYNIYENMTEDKDFMKNVYDNAINLKIVGLAKMKKETIGMSSGVIYTKGLTEYMIKNASESEIVKKQLENKDINVFSGKEFGSEDKSSNLNFEDLISIDKEMLSSAFGVKVNEKDIKNMTAGYMDEISKSITTDTSAAQADFLSILSTISKNILKEYISKNQVLGSGIATIKANDVEKIVNEGLAKQKNQALLADLENKYVIPKETFGQMYSGIITPFLTQYITLIGSTGINKDIPNLTNTDKLPQTNNTIENDIVNKSTGTNNTVSENTQTNNKVENITNTLYGKSKVQENTVSGNENKTINGVAYSVNKIANNEEKTELSAPIAISGVDSMVETFVNQEMVINASKTMAEKMLQVSMQKKILTKVGELTGELMKTMANSFNVDQGKIAKAFKFQLTEDDIKRIFNSFSSTSTQTANTNLLSLGYQDIEEPTVISFYFKDFDSKEKFINFIKDYNEKMEKEDKEKVIKYSDLTGMLMSSVKTIVDSVSYVLIAFVSISLVVSSIMIGIITYISVLERTKEIGILRAIGASKRNISSIFNAETFIVGMFSGILGITITLLLLIPINIIIHNINADITAVLPLNAGTILVVLSIILTLIGGLIPAKQASKKDPVLALRSE